MKHKPWSIVFGPYQYITVLNGKSDIIAHIDCFLEDRTTEAKLMAASPELLFACQKALSVLTDSRDPLFLLLQNAIWKAEGRIT